MKILNAFAGIGGNRKIWGNEHDITAIEINEDIANIYQDLFPDDKVIITDAHEYILKHYKEYDFIWSSPPCVTHSELKRNSIKGGIVNPEYPDLKLYEEIIFLKTFSKNKWVVENVKPYYDYLIEPNIILGRHPFWCNFYIELEVFIDKRTHKQLKGSQELYGYNLAGYTGIDKRQVLRNLVNPKIGKYILDSAMNVDNYKQNNLFDNV